MTETLTLQRLFDKVQDVENKVRLITDYLGIEKKTKPNYHAVTVTEPANNQLHAAKTTVANCGSSYKIPPAVKQRAVCVSTSKGNLAKNLLLEIFSPEERREEQEIAQGVLTAKGNCPNPLTKVSSLQ